MNIFRMFTVRLLFGILSFSGLARVSECSGNPGRDTLREVIVSHTDEDGILQLFRMKEDGSGSLQLTHSKHGCRMPSVSPNGKKLVYVKQVDHSLSLWLSGIDGKNARSLVSGGMNLIPSWLPDSKHIVWMKTQPGKKREDPASNSQIQIINSETGQSRRLFSDPDQIPFNDAMPSVSPDGKRLLLSPRDLVPFGSG
jgi:Tol biopolymer transport system component